MVSAPPRPRPDFTGVARGQIWEEEGPSDMTWSRHQGRASPRNQGALCAVDPPEKLRNCNSKWWTKDHDKERSFWLWRRACTIQRM